VVSIADGLGTPAGPALERELPARTQKEGEAARPQPPRLTLRTEPPEVGEGRFGPRSEPPLKVGEANGPLHLKT